MRVENRRRDILVRLQPNVDMPIAVGCRADLGHVDGCEAMHRIADSTNSVDNDGRGIWRDRRGVDTHLRLSFTSPLTEPDAV